MLRIALDLSLLVVFALVFVAPRGANSAVPPHELDALVPYVDPEHPQIHPISNRKASKIYQIFFKMLIHTGIEGEGHSLAFRPRAADSSSSRKGATLRSLPPISVLPINNDSIL